MSAANTDDLDADLKLRMQKTVEALNTHPAVVYADVDFTFQDVWAYLKTSCTQELETIEAIFGLENPVVSLKHTQDYGAVLDIWWDFAEDYELPDHPQNQTFDDFIDQLDENNELTFDYLEEVLAEPPDDNSFDLTPAEVPNTIPKYDRFPRSPPGWNYAGYEWLGDDPAINHPDFEEGLSCHSIALYLCQYRDRIAKLWLRHYQPDTAADDPLFEIELAEYPGNQTVIEFTTSKDDLREDVYETAEAWLTSHVETTPETIYDDLRKL